MEHFEKHNATELHSVSSRYLPIISSTGNMNVGDNSIPNAVSSILRHDKMDFNPTGAENPTYPPQSNFRNVAYVNDKKSSKIPPNTSAMSQNMLFEDILDPQSVSKNYLATTELKEGRPNRGRKRKHAECNRETNKKNRNSNKQFYDYKDNLREPRVFKDYECTCNKKCHEKFPSSYKKEEFIRFWALGSYDAQNAYIAAKIIEKPVKHASSKKRSFSREYLFNQVVVCKEIFKNTYQISSCRINTALKKVNARDNLLDRRGNAKSVSNTTPDDKIEDMRAFIKKVAKYESNYRRVETEPEFLTTNMTLSKLIELYKEEFKKCGM